MVATFNVSKFVCEAPLPFMRRHFLKDALRENEVDAPSKPPNKGGERSGSGVNLGKFFELESGSKLAGFIFNLGWSRLAGSKELAVKKEGLCKGEDEENDGAGKPKSSE